jgi:hypothetical protein
MQNSIYSTARYIWRPVRYTPIHRIVFPRRFHAICVGTPKSGTHSIAHLFNAHYRAAHEPDSKEFISQLLSNRESESLSTYLQNRNKKYWLEMEASHYLSPIVETLAKIYPDLKVILTIRDCYSWAQSQVNQLIRTPKTMETEQWFTLSDFYFGRPKNNFPNQEIKLGEYKNLYPLENLFRFWTDINSYVVNSVPKERLLILRTHEIGKKKKAIAHFLNISPQTIPRSRSHSGRAVSYDVDIFEAVDKHYIKDLGRTHCGELMTELFPEFELT